MIQHEHTQIDVYSLFFQVRHSLSIHGLTSTWIILNVGDESLATPWCSYDVNVIMCIVVCLFACFLVCDLNRTPIVMAKHGGPCVHFSGISTCGRTSRETASHPQHPPLPTLCKISLPVYVIVTNERLQPLTTTWYNSLVISFSVLNI